MFDPYITQPYASDKNSHKSITMRDFYLTLPSDSSLNTFQTNKQSDFVVKLDHPIYIDKDALESKKISNDQEPIQSDPTSLAQVEIITPFQVMNISEENNYFFIAYFYNYFSTHLKKG